MNRLILTFQTDDIKSFCVELETNKREYAQHWGFDYYCGEKSFNETPAHNKIYYIREMLDHYDEIAWVDMDIAFTNFKRNIFDLLDGFWLAALGESYFCTGLVVLRSKNARNFIEEIIRRLEANPLVFSKHPWEQTPFNDVLREIGHQGIHKCTEDEIGAFWKEGWYSNRFWRYGDFTIHLGGGGEDEWHRSWETRQCIFNSTYKSQIII